MAKAKISTKLWLLAAVVSIMVYQTTSPYPLGLGMVGLEGGPSALNIKVLDKTTGVADAICYMNPSGLSNCASFDGNTNRCQMKTVSGSDGLCKFAGPFNSSISWPIAVVCPAQFGGKRISKTISLLPGTNTVPIVCGTQSTTTTTVRSGGGGTGGGTVDDDVEADPNPRVTTTTIKKIANEEEPDGTAAPSPYPSIVYSLLSGAGVLYIGRKK